MDTYRPHDMTTRPNTAAERTAITAANVEVEAHLARADTKATTMLGLAGAALFAAGNLLPLKPSWLICVSGAATLAFCAAALVLAWVLRPQLATASGQPHGLMRLAGLNVTEIRLALSSSDDADYRTQQLMDVTALAVRKYRRIQCGINLIAVGLCLAVLAMMLGWILR